MTTTNTQRHSAARAARRTTLCLLALVAALCHAHEARAQWTTSGTNTTTTNNVGVGTATPEAGLHISTSSTVPGSRGIIDEQTSNDATAATFLFRKSRAGAAVQNGDNIGHMSGAGFDGTSFVTASRLRFIVDGAVSAGNVPMGMQFLTGTNGSGVERMRITSAGNFGIGTAAPGVVNGVNFAPYIPVHIQAQGTGVASLLVDSASPSSGFVLNDSSQTVDNRMWSISQAAGGGKLTFATHTDAGTASNRVVIDRAGNMGVGTTTPGFLLDVSGSASTPLRVRDSSGREYISTSIRTGPVATWTWPIVSLSGGRLIVDSTSPDGGNDTIVRRVVNSLIFNPSDHPTLPGAFMVRQVGGNAALFIDQNANGNVGIGTTAPASKLHVAGSITVDGNINAKYQDVAEWVPSTEKLLAGTVVVLDAAHSNHVLASTKSYDTRVAGVVSAQPGITLGEAGEGKALVATTGRVKVKVDASRGAIHVGDLIVTSDAPGVAMRSEPVSLGGVTIHRPGTIIGKALESLEKGTGEILVLLSLQ
jgi:hypothetical protein